MQRLGLEGGLWALLTDDGRHVELIDPPAAIQQHELRVEIEVDEENAPEVSIGMVGGLARVKSFTLL